MYIQVSIPGHPIVQTFYWNQCTF